MGASKYSYTIAIIVILVNLCTNKYVSCNSPNQQSSTQSAAMETASMQNGASIHYPSVKEIVDRLHQLDVDIGRLMFNSTSLFAPPMEQLTYTEQSGVSKSSDSTAKFTEVLTDLDSLQDEVNVIMKNVTRTRQYNLLVRLRPLNTLLYRIRNNLYLMRNSLIALNTVTSLEKIANSVLDTTLTVFLKPETPAGGANDEATGDENHLIDDPTGNVTSIVNDLDASSKPDLNEEAAIAEAEAAAANEQYDKPPPPPPSPLTQDQQTTAATTSTTLTTTTTTPTTTTTTTAAPQTAQNNNPSSANLDQPARRPDQQQQQGRPIRIRFNQTSRPPQQVTATSSQTVSNTTVTTSTPAETTSSTSGNSRNTNRANNNTTRSRPRPNRPHLVDMLELNTE